MVGQFLLGERQEAAVSPSPGWRLAIAASGTPLYVPGAPWAVRGSGTWTRQARMPQARPCRPMRSGRQGEQRRCRHAWPHASQPASRRTGACVGALGALCLGVGLGAEAVEVCRWRGVCWQPGVLQSLWALAVSMLLPAACKHKEEEGPSLISAHYLCPSIGQSRRATATGPRNVLPWLITP